MDRITEIKEETLKAIKKTIYREHLIAFIDYDESKLYGRIGINQDNDIINSDKSMFIDVHELYYSVNVYSIDRIGYQLSIKADTLDSLCAVITAFFIDDRITDRSKSHINYKEWKGDQVIENLKGDK